MEKNTYVQAALVADRARRMPVPTLAGLRGGAVPFDSSFLARDSAHPRILMV
ncbi:hypothetical protein [Cellulomonas sp. ATA003]|uniref:hypothetical protein n=1 Tax=Cellulomonas sp. ATA003 TaxID=3073064 RepID=UPI0028736133|nr:hypothetical protein [Cellulomonas sp. ATA003]WNB86131.1 hypothetical protein REH70_02295 [Cellulomonas sp. ATA003]